MKRKEIEELFEQQCGCKIDELHKCRNYTYMELLDFAEKVAKLCTIPHVVGQSELLFAFIKAIKEEFADQNWDYLDFIADRVTAANT